MMIGPQVRQQLRATPELRAVPGLLHVLIMLPLSHQQVTDMVDAALAENPMLERLPGFPCPSCGRHSRAGQCASCRHVRADPTDIPSPDDELSTLALCEVRADCRAAMPTVLAHLTARGLLDSEPSEIASLHHVPEAVVQECVRALRAVGPPGIAERSVGDLLAAQARRSGDALLGQPWVGDLLRNDLELVASGDAQNTARRYRVSESDAGHVFDAIARRLRPYVSVAADPPPRTPPDVLAERDETGALRVEVADSAWFGLRIADIPAEVASDAAACAWLKGYRDSASDLVQQLNSRARTLSTIARAAVLYQSDFVDKGPPAHRPLTRAALAASVGLSESTVSRAVKGKRLRLPDGTMVDLAALFGKSVAARAELQMLADNDSLSDLQLSELLIARGYAISRRTVAKYRSELGITRRKPRRTLR
jgi:RNA polymerase sigma-54 factor